MQIGIPPLLILLASIWITNDLCICNLIIGLYSFAQVVTFKHPSHPHHPKKPVMRVLIPGFRLPIHLINLPSGGDDALHAPTIYAGLGRLGGTGGGGFAGHPAPF